MAVKKKKNLILWQLRSPHHSGKISLESLSKKIYFHLKNDKNITRIYFIVKSFRRVFKAAGDKTAALVYNKQNVLTSVGADTNIVSVTFTVIVLSVNSLYSGS